jgi:DNA invertase Pin-like site-specific DNA recombinase
MAKIGYARVSTRDQHPEVQRERLEAAGCTRVYEDKGASGVRASRPEWDKCLERLEPGDALVSVRLDRIGRSVQNLIDVANLLRDRGVDLVCLDQPIDTTTPLGKMFFTILAAFAEFEHDLIVERTKDGLASTKARGREGGRKHRLTPAQQAQAARLRADGHSIREIGVLLGDGKPVSRQTVYRALGMIGPDPRRAKSKDAT